MSLGFDSDLERGQKGIFDDYEFCDTCDRYDQHHGLLTWDEPGDDPDDPYWDEPDPEIELFISECEDNDREDREKEEQARRRDDRELDAIYRRLEKPKRKFKARHARR